LHINGSPGPEKRPPSPLARELDDAMAPCAGWSEVRVIRNEFGQRRRIVAEPSQRPPDDMPYDWAEAA
jgi:hypothetical protein